jgi:hypothetical protein
MTRTKIERIHKNPEKYEIDLIIGVDDNPDDAKNAMFYVRMESFRKETEKQDRAREIWLSNEEDRLIALFSMASKFWKKYTLKKNTVRTKKKIARFKEKWKLARAVSG